MEGHQGGTHIGSVAVTQRDEVFRVLVSEEFRKFVGLVAHVLLVENAFSESLKPSRHSVLVDFASRTDNRGPRNKIIANLHEIVFCATSSVEEQKGPSLAWIGCGIEVEMETHGNYL